tara:strand:- start:2 stop:361 length:360 start_codon:yes stop_codon:yes gene_type:complete
MSSKIKTICFDIDNTICNTKGSDYKKSKPILKNIKFINYLYQKGFKIKIFTARYMGRNNDNQNKAKKMAKKITLQQLKKWNLKYHRIYFGKPSSDLYIDDKNLNFSKNWSKKVKNLINK